MGSASKPEEQGHRCLPDTAELLAMLHDGECSELQIALQIHGFERTVAQRDREYAELE